MQKLADAKVDDDERHHPSCKKKVCRDLTLFELFELSTK